jgi:hypothetical protein
VEDEHHPPGCLRDLHLAGWFAAERFSYRKHIGKGNVEHWGGKLLDPVLQGKHPDR